LHPSGVGVSRLRTSMGFQDCALLTKIGCIVNGRVFPIASYGVPGLDFIDGGKKDVGFFTSLRSVQNPTYNF